MTLSDLASIGSFISGLSVLATGIYLAVQMRQSAKHQRSMIHHDRAEFVRQSTMANTSPEAMRLWVRGSRGDPEMDEEEVRRFVWQVSAALVLFEEYFYQHKDGMLDDARWNSNQRRLKVMLRQPGIRAVWRTQVAQFEPDFIAFVEAAMAATPVAKNTQLGPRWKALAAEEMGKTGEPAENQSLP